MKITHPSGDEYDLYPDTEIEVTRYNPFFHTLGEQSVPVSLPSTAKNLRILGNPERPENANKTASRIDAAIQSGAFSVVGRQAILSAQAKGSVETSFYLNEGAFYEKMTNLTLSEIFKDRVVDFGSVDGAINFMKSLLSVSDPRFAVFEVFTDEYLLNEISFYLGEPYFVKEDETTETINESKITVPKGFYITPFVKVKHVLQEVFTHMGYSLGSSFLDAPPFNDMVFLNDNLDTIAGGSIHYVDVVPNIDVKTLLDVLRKFNIEFIPDETNRVVNIKAFDHVFLEPSSADISQYAVSIPVINYPDSYKQVRLSSEKLSIPAELSYLARNGRRLTYQREAHIDGDLLLIEILNQYPTAYLRRKDGAIVRDGVRGDVLFTEKLCSLGMDYFSGGDLKPEEFSFPDTVTDMEGLAPYAGAGRTLQSRIQLSSENEDGDDTNPTKTKDLPPILCLFYRKSGYCLGTFYNYDNEGNRLWDYSIQWNGPDGIFEKFWRQRDSLLRNALLPVQVDAILPEHLKLSIPSVRRLSFNGQGYLISELQYSTKPNSPGACSLLSTNLQKPISEAPFAHEQFREKTYKWNRYRTYSVTGTPGRPYSYRFDAEPVPFYPPDPTPAQYAAGGRYHERIYTVEYGFITNGVFTKSGECNMTVWLEPALY